VTPTVGVLALQGAFAAHSAILGRLGVDCAEVRSVAELQQVDALVMPGGESTTMSMLLERNAMSEPLSRRIADAMPVLGTCAGLILLAAELLDGRPDQRPLGAIDITARRNAYGRQIDSFETELQVSGLDTPFHGVFIRAPVVERCGPEVEVLARHRGEPVLCCEGNVTVASFHPELADDDRIHSLWLRRSGLVPEADPDGSPVASSAAHNGAVNATTARSDDTNAASVRSGDNGGDANAASVRSGGLGARSGGLGAAT